MGSSRDRFAALVAAGPDLARGALEIARLGHPDLDAEACLARLDALAETIRPHLPAGDDPPTTFAAAATHLFGELGFHGNSTDYYDPRNSYLPDVLERRTGIPIMLALVLIEVGTRLGLTVEGIAFPGHFLVRVRGARGLHLFDPFTGQALDEAELLSRARAVAGAGVTAVPPHFLATAGPRAMLTRMLHNLLRVFHERDDPDHALAAVDLLLVLTPDAPEAVRTRGLLLARLDCPGAAAHDLERYLELAPGAADAADIRNQLARLARGLPTLH
ncbi:MAG: tetratricopeptide repeat protein [Candidatus Binatia bacterium]